MNHKIREIWRWYRCAVEYYGPRAQETKRIRKSLRALLQYYTRTSVRLDEPRTVLGLA